MTRADLYIGLAFNQNGEHLISRCTDSSSGIALYFLITSQPPLDQTRPDQTVPALIICIIPTQGNARKIWHSKSRTHGYVWLPFPMEWVNLNAWSLHHRTKEKVAALFVEGT
jgi:hypothetical protein